MWDQNSTISNEILDRFKGGKINDSFAILVYLIKS